MTVRFNRKFLAYSIALFLIEVWIAVYVHEAIIRPNGADFLVVILLFCLVNSVLVADKNAIALSALFFSCILETLQYFGIVEILGLGHSTFANAIIGTSFAWIDTLAYTLGVLMVLVAEREILI